MNSSVCRCFNSLLIYLLVSLSFFPSFAKTNGSSNRYYFMESTVLSKNNQDKENASKELLRQLLTRLTGEVITSQELPKSTNSFVDEYFYNEKDGELVLSLAFNKKQLHQYLSEKKKTQWPNQTPLLMWIFEKGEEGYRWISPQTNSELTSQLTDLTIKRGLSPIVLEPDLSLLDSLSSTQAKASIETKLPLLSQEYNLPFFIAFFLDQQGADSFKLEAITYYKQFNDFLIVADEATTPLFEKALNKIIPQIKERLKEQDNTPHTFIVKIQNLTDPERYEEIQTFFRSIDEIEHVFLESLTEDSATYKIDALLSESALLNKIAQNHKLTLFDKNDHILTFELQS